MMAAVMGHSHIVKILLERGANVFLAANNKGTALHGGAQEGHLAVVELLAKAGADLEALTRDGRTPLHLATSSGSADVVRALIEAGANPDSQWPDGTTALFQAAEAGHLDALRELLRAKANPLLEHVDPNKTTAVPLDVAADRGHSDVVRELLQQFGIEGCGARGTGVYALVYAAAKQRLDVMAILTGAGVADNGLALIEAADRGREASVKFLLRQQHEESKGSVEDAYIKNAITSNGNTPLFAILAKAAYFSQAPRIVRLLVDAGADTTSPIRITDSKGELLFNGTPLALTSSWLREELDANGKTATEEYLRRLKAIFRLLLRVEAVHAVSWLWPSNAPFISHAAQSGPDPPLPPLRRMLPILKRRTKGRGGLAATLLRWVVK
ncbi:unnamed protein product [Ectocarpus fasciculatus]